MLKRFPILYDYSGRREADHEGWPLTVPWDLIAPHEEQALKNHSQTLSELASRGGLSPCELLAVLTNIRWTPVLPGRAISKIMELGGLKLRCVHDRLNEDGICRTCSQDCRRGK